MSHQTLNYREKVTRATMQPLQIQREGLVIFNMVVYVDGELTVRVKTGETKNDGHGPTIELTPLVGNKRMFSQTCRQLKINLCTV